MKESHSFMFEFYSREQFYGVVHLLERECGKGNWTIKGRVLKSLKHHEEMKAKYSWYQGAPNGIKKEIVIPNEFTHLEALLRLRFSGWET